MEFKAVVIGGPLHRQVHESNGPVFYHYMLPKEMPEVSHMSAFGEGANCNTYTYVLHDLSYRHGHKLHPLKVWMPDGVKDPYAYLLSMALATPADAAHKDSGGGKPDVEL